MADDQQISIPPKLWFSKVLEGNQIRQLQYPRIDLSIDDPLRASLEPGTQILLHGKKILVSKTKRQTAPDGIDDVLWIPETGKLDWSRKHELTDIKWEQIFSRREEAASSLENKFVFIEEERNADSTVKRPGLRSPQIGAIYAALAHWRMSSEVATIVLPTGTGKTDCMVALMALRRPRCLLVTVPTDALRTQLADKFLSLGVLVANGLLPTSSTYPVVGILKKGFESAKQLEVFCDACNVIVTTMSLLATFSDSEQKSLASHCDYLFIDEAHHVKSATWSKLRTQFAERLVLQFTATPYRNDGQHVDGRIIFDFPLLLAQAQGYFNKIVLRELWDYVDIDSSVASAAINQLNDDLTNGFDHLLMARASTIPRAEALKLIYDTLGGKYSPVIIHSKLKSKDLEQRLDQLRNRKSRIVVCVSMFGEGYDFPELKIAAVHDIHQSLAVTIQFTGRFTRSKTSVGDATIVVSRADDKIDESVRELYSYTGGSDWNAILSRLSEKASKGQQTKQAFFDSFADDPAPLPIENVRPKMSTVVYQVGNTKWTPAKIKDLPLAKRLYGNLAISPKEHTAFFVVLVDKLVEWADPVELKNRTFDLYVIFWDSVSGLLYINSSNNDGVHEDIAKAVGGSEAKLISGTDCFRALGGIKRLLLRNMGVNDTNRSSVRFIMYAGADIKEYLESVQIKGREKTHVFGDGFDGNSRITVGTSKKGRLWSWQEAKDLLEWKTWCQGIGAKLINSAIEQDSFLQSSDLVQEITKAPNLYPVTIEWPDSLFHQFEQSILIGKLDSKMPFFEIGIELIDPQPNGPLKFSVFSEDFSAAYTIVFTDGKAFYRPEHEDLLISTGLRGKAKPLSDFFATAHPLIRYEKEWYSIGNHLMEPRERTLFIFDRNQIIVWDWAGVDPTVESQTRKKFSNSIQRRTIDNVQSKAWDRAYQILFDDDAPGESADVVGLQITEDKLFVDLFHCKYTNAKPGNRIKDLFDVCGQAQRSIKWKDSIDRFFLHLMNREKARMAKYGVSRFELGDYKELVGMRGLARSVFSEFRIFIVQPGVSQTGITDDMREPLSSTEFYLKETRNINLRVIGRA